MLRREYVGGILAGLLIGIGGSVFLACDDKYIGAVLFSVALLCICLRGYSLYTGKVGFLVFNYGARDFAALGMCFLGNLTGTVLMGVSVGYALPALADKAFINCTAKMAVDMPAAFFRAIFCGMLMYLAVVIYRQKNSISAIFFCVPVFILSGFEHSVANLFYFALGYGFPLDACLYLAVIVLGNSVGAWVIAGLERLSAYFAETEKKSA